MESVRNQKTYFYCIAEKQSFFILSQDHLELYPNTCICFCKIETDPDQKWACLNVFALQSLMSTVNHQQHCNKEPLSKTSYTVIAAKLVGGKKEWAMQYLINYQILNY